MLLFLPPAGDGLRRPSIPMLTGSTCDCLICRLEASLLAELSREPSQEEFRLLGASGRNLTIFQTATELVRRLHSHVDNEPSISSDELLQELVTVGTDALFPPMWQSLLLLVFIPTIHHTTSRITAAFPSLTRDDTAQHLFAILLELLRSKELRSRRSHLAFTIARKIRREGFRWAIRETRKSLDEVNASRASPLREEAGDDEFNSGIELQEFLDNCQRMGRLSSEERELLTQFKINGISGKELARGSGRSALALRHRVQRLLNRLRRIARKSGTARPQQLDLFSH